MPKVSICIPAYNQTEYLCKTFNSILIQTYTDYEIIVTDDSPTTIVAELIEKYDFKGKLKYYHNKTPLGSPANWNFSISRSQGDYIKLLHHDDWFSCDTSLENLVKILETGDNSLAFCGCNNIAPDGGTLFYHSITENEASAVRANPEFLFFNNRIGAPSVTIFKRNSIIFDKKIKYLVDVDFYIQLLKANNKFSYTTVPLVDIGHNEGQVTNTAVNDKSLLIFEYSYTYNKLTWSRNNFKWRFNAFWNLFINLNIQSIKELKDYGWQGKMPQFVKLIVDARIFMKNAHANRLHKSIKAIVYNYSKIIDRY